MPRKRHLSAGSGGGGSSGGPLLDTGNTCANTAAAAAAPLVGNPPATKRRPQPSKQLRRQSAMPTFNRPHQLQQQQQQPASCVLCCLAPEGVWSSDRWRADLRSNPGGGGGGSDAAGVSAHYKCMLFASGLPQACDPDDDDDEEKDGGGKTTAQRPDPSRLLAGFDLTCLAKEVKRGLRLRCSHCRKPGATAGCQAQRCVRSYHLPCAQAAGALLVHTGSFTVHCAAHWPAGLANAFAERVRLVGDVAALKCPVCLDSLPPLEANDAYREVVFGPCCRNCFGHRHCIQEYANSAGDYFLKCPLCGNGELFRAALIDQGLEIPCRDASWELDANAYASHSYRPRLCSLPGCPDPEVDHYGRWLLKICYICGADARHVTCAGLKTGHHRYACDVCSEALGAPPPAAAAAAPAAASAFAVPLASSAGETATAAATTEPAVTSRTWAK